MDIDHHHDATWAYQALESNKRYHETLAQRASKLEAELEEIERLLVRCVISDRMALLYHGPGSGRPQYGRKRQGETKGTTES